MMQIEKNKDYTVTITDVTNLGDGIAKLDGYTLFIPGTVTGDVAEIKAIKLKKNYGYGKLNKLLTPSSHRAQPLCPVHRQCGGCSLMHMSYDYQKELKTKYVKEVLTRIGKVENPNVLPCLGMEHPYEFRNKMIFPISKNKEGQAVFGFYAKHSHRVVTFPRCYIGEEIFSSIAQTTVDFMNRYHIPPYDEIMDTGAIRRVFLRKGYHTGEIMVVISSNQRNIPHLELLVEQLKGLDEHIVSILLNINQGINNQMLGKENILLWGRETITDQLCGNTFRISPHSFYQVNPLQTQVLYETALDYAQLTGAETVYDLYCGICTISLAAAQRAKQVIGIEIVPQAIEDAKNNAVINQHPNAQFYCGPAEEWMPKLVENQTADVVILDPPRKGSDPVTLGAICRCAPKRIVYVSCDPATLARDVEFLTQQGYHLVKAQPVDMFPHSAHVETVALLTKEETR